MGKYRVFVQVEDVRENKIYDQQLDTDSLQSLEGTLRAAGNMICEDIVEEILKYA